MDISCCGTDCGSCGLRGNLCQGCNESSGKVFHAPEGRACPIYECCRSEKKYDSCGACDQLPCGTILGTRDPSLSEDEFMKTVSDRVARLRGGVTDGL